MERNHPIGANEILWGQRRCLSLATGILFLLLVTVSGCSKAAEDIPEESLEPGIQEEELEEVNATYEEFDFSVEGIQKQLDEEPGRPDLIFMLMSAKLDAGDFQGALELVKPLDEVGDPAWSAQGHMMAGRIIRDHMLVGAEGELRDELLPRAMKQFEIAIEFDRSSNMLPAFLYLGQLQREAGDIENAIENLSLFLTLSPHSYDARLELAEVYAEQGEKSRALFLLEEMKSDPNDERREKAMALQAKLGKSSAQTYWVTIALLSLITVGVAIYVMRKGTRAKPV